MPSGPTAWPGSICADLQIDRLAPRSANVVGPDHVVRSIRADAREVDVVAAAVLHEIRRPHRADVLEQRWADRLPVDEIARVPDHQARIGVERRERHVVVVAVFQDRRVGVIAGKNRIEDRCRCRGRPCAVLRCRAPRRPAPSLADGWRAPGDADRHRQDTKQQDQRTQRVVSDPAMRLHPIGESRHPAGRRAQVRRHAEAVRAALVEMRLDRHAARAAAPRRTARCSRAARSCPPRCGR